MILNKNLFKILSNKYVNYFKFKILDKLNDCFNYIFNY